MHDMITWLGDLPSAAIYVIAALLVFTETGLVLGLALPGEFTLLFVGFLCYAGTLRPLPAIVIMLAAAMCGDLVGYLEGRRLGPALRNGRLGSWVGARRWDRAAALFERHGGRAVFVGRFVAFARTLTPRLASAAGLSLRRFVAWDVLGTTVQVLGSVLIGYLAGTSFARVAELLGRASGALLMLALLIVGLIVFGRYLGRHPDPVADVGRRLRNSRPLRTINRAYNAGFGWLLTRAGVAGAVVASLLLGIGVLLVIGVGLTWAVDGLVTSSGVPLVDPILSSWVDSQRSPASVEMIRSSLSVIPGWLLVAAAGVVGLVLNLRATRWQADLLGVVSTVGGFIPLAILAVAAEWVLPAGAGEAGESAAFPNQVTVVTASVGMLAWLLSRRLRWAATVAVWLVGVGLVMLASAARVYVGWSWPSEVVASVLLGSLWVLVFAAAWHTRDRLRATDRAERDQPGQRVHSTGSVVTRVEVATNRH